MKGFSIRKKVWFGIAATAAAVIGLSSLLVFYLYERLYVDEQIARFTEEGQALAQVYEEYGASEALFDRMEWLDETTDALYLFTEDPMELSGGVPFESAAGDELITYEERQVLLQGDTVLIRREHPRFHQDMLGIAIPLLDGDLLGGAVFISMPLADVYDAFADIQWLLYSALVLAVAIIAFLGNRITRRLLDPLLKMKAVAKKMAQGDFSKRVTIGKKEDEMDELARSLNHLAHSLQQVEENRRLFLADLAHELRTPLSYMVGYIEGMQEGVMGQEQGMAILSKETARLNRLVNDLLDLAQLEGEAYPLKLDAVVFAELIREASETVAFEAKRKEMHLSLELDEDSIIQADRDRMKQVIMNLLTNAIAYSEPKKTIKITLIATDGKALLTIHDQGFGIPKTDLPYVTDRFFRVKRARSRENGGTGLGLAIVQEIIARHNGLFLLESNDGDGTKAIVQLNEFNFENWRGEEQ